MRPLLFVVVALSLAGVARADRPPTAAEMKSWKSIRGVVVNGSDPDDPTGRTFTMKDAQGKRVHIYRGAIEGVVINGQATSALDSGLHGVVWYKRKNGKNELMKSSFTAPAKPSPRK